MESPNAQLDLVVSELEWTTSRSRKVKYNGTVGLPMYFSSYPKYEFSKISNLDF